ICEGQIPDPGDFHRLLRGGERPQEDTEGKDTNVSAGSVLHDGLLLFGPLFGDTCLRAAEPLINRPFCPDNMILMGFSGSFARCLLSTLSGYTSQNTLCFKQHQVNSLNSLMKSGRSSASSTILSIRNAPTWSGSCGLCVFTVCGRVRTC